MSDSRSDYFFKKTIESFYNFIIVDDKGIIVYVNEFYARVMGVDQEKVIGRYVADVIPNTRMLEVLENKQIQIGSLMTIYDHTLGQDVTVVCNRRPIWDGDTVIGAMAETTNLDLGEVDTLYNEIMQIRKENSIYKAQLEMLTQQRGPLDTMIGRAVALVELKKSILTYAPTTLPILICGETGTGKELFSNAIQQLSSRNANSFVKVNCAAVPKELLESEFFGYADGAFTGAVKGGKPGKFELANNGTLLLDEIGELPLPLQAKLLRVLQENELERLGSNQTIKLNIRILCSTNQDLEDMVNQGLFRSDLYYRINTVELCIPPLRQRPEDIPLLVTHFIRKVNQEYNLKVSSISAEAQNLLAQHTWPGNVRELEHVLERACVLCKAGSLEKWHFEFLALKLKSSQSGEPGPDDHLTQWKTSAECEAILLALQRAGGNKAKAARMLGIDRSNLYIKMKKFHIDL